MQVSAEMDLLSWTMDKLVSGLCRESLKSGQSPGSHSFRFPFLDSSSFCPRGFETDLFDSSILLILPSLGQSDRWPKIHILTFIAETNDDYMNTLWPREIITNRIPIGMTWGEILFRHTGGPLLQHSFLVPN